VKPPHDSSAAPSTTGAREAATTGELSEQVVSRVLLRKERLLAFLEQRVGNRPDAEDLLQTALVRLVTKGRSLRAEDRILRWFYRVLRNLLVDWHRRRAARARMLAHVSRSHVSTPGWDEPLYSEVCACVRDVLGTFEEGTR
jgi:RNA polymerase sigma-70 factor (ECF subfamily)